LIDTETLIKVHHGTPEYTIITIGNTAFKTSAHSLRLETPYRISKALSNPHLDDP
jgi:hypothetical protein